MAQKDNQLTRVAFGVSKATDAARTDALRLLEADTALHLDWIAGLALNGAAPDEVLRRVFSVDPLPGAQYWLHYHELPPEAARTAAAHPDPQIRMRLAENPHLPADVRAVLAEDPDPKVRRIALIMAHEYRDELPAELTVRIAADPEARMRCVAAGLPGLPEATLLALAGDPDPRVRAAAMRPGNWPRLSAGVRAAAETDPDPLVREAFERATRVEAPLPTTVEGFLAEEDEHRRARAAFTAPVDEGLAAFLVTHEDGSLRHDAARNPHVPKALAHALAADPEPSVRLAVSLRGDLTEEQRAAIDYVVPPGRHGVPAWVKDRFGDPDALREIAASGHVLLRRAVTCAPELPADVIERLAADEDYYVKLMLCDYDHAPHELLVEMFADWNGLSWATMVYRRNFAHPGLARFEDHPNVRLRYAALFDPQGGPELVERLTHDTHEMVRRHAAADPRLPLPRLVELLGTDGMARAAARNPALPPELMHELLDVAGVLRWRARRTALGLWACGVLQLGGQLAGRHRGPVGDSALRQAGHTLFVRAALPGAARGADRLRGFAAPQLALDLVDAGRDVRVGGGGREGRAAEGQGQAGKDACDTGGCGSGGRAHEAYLLSGIAARPETGRATATWERRRAHGGRRTASGSLTPVADRLGSVSLPHPTLEQPPAVRTRWSLRPDPPGPPEGWGGWGWLPSGRGTPRPGAGYARRKGRVADIAEPGGRT
ncbi:hypothetical protein SAVIM338S_00370 [Streptomyces avidinii]